MSTFGKDETQRYGSPTTQMTYKFDRPHLQTIYYIADNSCPENKHCLCNFPVPECKL